ncbi:MAG: glycosyl transferase family 2, partial [Bacteroidetes bacterium]|nr:glycosyl transferase family 2 [Bacteroidota bacterium]
MVERRAQDPYKSFMTNNFLIRKEVYDAVKMDESVVGYGHEDTLFAIELKKAGFKVKHIDNPLEHIGLETFDEFLRKSENGIRNLALLIQSKKVDSSIKLVRYYQRLESFGLISLVNTLVAKYEHRIFKNLRSTAPYLTWFDLWKLSKLDFYMKSTS